MSKKMVYMLIAVVLVLSVAAELFGIHLHAPHWWPLPFGYNIFSGFIGGWILIILAKMIMTPLLQREDDYYEKGGGENND